MGTTSIDEVLSGLDRIIEQALDEGGRHGYFAVLYRKVTAKVHEGIERGMFADAARMERLDCTFADRYLDAVASHRAGQEPTASWKLTFDAGKRWRPLVLQQLVVGINAHINLDLGIAAARCSPGAALADLRRDYDLVNAILASMIATIQKDLLVISPWMGLLDRVGARTQTELVRFSIVTARAGAWRFATRLAATAESEWDDLIADRDERVAQVGRRVLRPGPWMSGGLLLARMREQGDVRANLRLLLGAAEPSLETVVSTVDDPRLASPHD